MNQELRGREAIERSNRALWKAGQWAGANERDNEPEQDDALMERYADAHRESALTTDPEELMEDAHLYSEFHEACGYRFDAHSNRDPHSTLPFGCPSESAARAAYGDR